MRGDGRVFLRNERWWIAFQRNGKEVREPARTKDGSAATSREAAEKCLRRRRDDVAGEERGGRQFETSAQRRIPVSELLDSLERDYKLRRGRALPQFTSHLKPIRDFFGDLRATSVTGDTIDHYIESRLAEKDDPDPPASATVNRETALLRQAFKLAVQERKLVSIPNIRHLAESGPRKGFFERPDFEAVVAELPAHLQDFARFGYLSGWRKGEIQTLLWSDVDRDGKVIRLRHEESKNGEARTLTIDGELWHLIERRWKAREYECADKTVAFSLHVFHKRGEPVGDFRKAWAAACKAADVTGRLFHDLRRTAVRNMIRAGVPERVAMAVSGHKTRAIFDRYNIVSEADLRQAMERTQAYIATQPAKRNVTALAKAAAR